METLSLWHFAYDALHALHSSCNMAEERTASVLVGERGQGTVLLYQRYRYICTKKESAANKWHFRCKERCGATLHTAPLIDGHGTVAVTFVGQKRHNHRPPDDHNKKVA